MSHPQPRTPRNRDKNRTVSHPTLLYAVKLYAITEEVYFNTVQVMILFRLGNKDLKKHGGYWLYEKTDRARGSKYL